MQRGFRNYAMSIATHNPIDQIPGKEQPGCARVGDLIAERRALHMPAGATVLEAAKFMSMMQMGAILIVEDGALAGIFTERDVLNHVVAAGQDPGTTLIGDVMTRELLTVGPSTPAEEALALMLERNIRHLPVLEGAALAGIVSLRDLVGGQHPPAGFSPQGRRHRIVSSRQRPQSYSKP